MNLRIGILAAFVVAASALPAKADGVIPYPDAGTLAPTDTFSAIATGNVTGYFYGASAADVDVVQMCDTTTTTCSAFAFDNQTTAAGATYNFGAVNAGDTLVFTLDNLNTGQLLSSDPALSADGLNHAYAADFAGGADGSATLPAGEFIGMEDLSVPGSDLDYNDDQFVFTNVAAVATPEPSSFLLLGAGILGLLAIKRRQPELVTTA